MTTAALRVGEALGAGDPTTPQTTTHGDRRPLAAHEYAHFGYASSPVPRAYSPRSARESHKSGEHRRIR